MKKFINGLLGLLGYAVVRTETRNRLLSGPQIAQDSPKTAKDSPSNTAEDPTENFNRLITERAEGELRRNSTAHNFRLIPKTEEPTVAVPQTYMQTLLRESLALRDQSGEIARLNRELAMVKHSVSASNHSMLDA